MVAPSAKLRKSLEECGSKFACQRSEIPLFSTVTGTLVSGRKLDAQYWEDNLKEPVKFWGAITAAMKAQILPQQGGVQKVRSILGPGDVPKLCSNLPVCIVIHIYAFRKKNVILKTGH